ncbi:MAG: TIGR02147 family protein [Pseudomonadota bacterium]|nr:TIGR02147 family protein [Pseudomonadota bacterium]
MKEIQNTDDFDSGGNADVQVTQYTDYRSYLSAYFFEAQSKNPRFSYGAWSRKLNTKDTSTITKIVKGHRHPGPKLIERMISYFKFDSGDARYFRSMIQLEKIKEESSMRLSILESLGKSEPQTSRQAIPSGEFALISHWYGLAIRQLSKIPGFKVNPKWISGKLQFPVGQREISDMLKNLIQLGLLKINDDGTASATPQSIHTTDDQPNLHLQMHHTEMLENAKLALAEVDLNLREFTSLTFPIKISRVGDAKKLLRKFKADFDRLLSETPNQECNSVYQFQMQLFPLTRWDNA